MDRESLNLLTGSLSTSQSGGTAIVGLALNTTTTASLAEVDVSKLAAGTTYTLAQVDADTISISDGTTTVNLDNTEGTIGADGQITFNFTGAIEATLKVVGAAAKTVGDVFTDLDATTIITAAGSGSATFRVGAATTDNVTVTFSNMQSAALGSGGANDIGDLVTDNTAVDTIAEANTLLQAVDAAIAQVSATRSQLCAAQNQLETSVNSLGVAVENLSASESRIRDADIASVSTELVASQIMQQAGIAVLSQANASAQSVLALLQ